MNLQCFEPEILYAFDLWNQPDNENMIHHHDFFEISIHNDKSRLHAFRKFLAFVRRKTYYKLSTLSTAACSVIMHKFNPYSLCNIFLKKVLTKKKRCDII